jgi:hypothetical protein
VECADVLQLLVKAVSRWFANKSSLFLFGGGKPDPESQNQSQFSFIRWKKKWSK